MCTYFLVFVITRKHCFDIWHVLCTHSVKTVFTCHHKTKCVFNRHRPKSKKYFFACHTTFKNYTKSTPFFWGVFLSTLKKGPLFLAFFCIPTAFTKPYFEKTRKKGFFGGVKKKGQNYGHFVNGHFRLFWKTWILAKIKKRVFCVCTFTWYWQYTKNHVLWYLTIIVLVYPIII